MQGAIHAHCLARAHVAQHSPAPCSILHVTARRMLYSLGDSQVAWCWPLTLCPACCLNHAYISQHTYACISACKRCAEARTPPAGRKLYRINLSEQTDIMDLLGADLPVQGGAPGAFAWCGVVTFTVSSANNVSHGTSIS
jgi:hypothetical protein